MPYGTFRETWAVEAAPLLARLSRTAPEAALRLKHHAQNAAASFLDLAHVTDAADAREVQRKLKSAWLASRRIATLPYARRALALAPPPKAPPKNAVAAAKRMVAAAVEEEEPQKNAAGGPNTNAAAAAAAAPTTPASEFLSDQRFDALAVDDGIKKGIKQEFGYELMSRAQAQCIPAALGGTDVLVKAETGNGKTLGFLIPALQRAIASPAGLDGNCCVVVLLHTQTLARQTQREAEHLVACLKRKDGGKVRVGLAIGKDSTFSVMRLLLDGVDVLIATPKRLESFLKDGPNAEKFRAMYAQCRAFVMDEADQLLSGGYDEALKTIVGTLPKSAAPANAAAKAPPACQMLLFSATFEGNIQTKCVKYLKPGYVTVVVESVTKADIRQAVTVLPMETAPDGTPLLKIMLALYRVLLKKREERKDDFKIMVFFPTKVWVAYATELMHLAGMTDVLQLHADVSESQKHRTETAFRNETKRVLFASDMSARGVDYPNVTLVVQVGMVPVVNGAAPDYKHRKGRTGRGGKTGEAITLLGDDEARKYAPLIKGFEPEAQVNVALLGDDDAKRYATLVADKAAKQPALDGFLAEPVDAAAQRAFDDAVRRMADNAAARKLAERAYVGTLGFYKGQSNFLQWKDGGQFTPLWTAMDARFNHAGAGGKRPEVSDKLKKKLFSR